MRNSEVLEKGFRFLAVFCWRHARWIVLSALLLFSVSLVYTANNLTFKTGRNDLIGPQDAYRRIYESFKKEFDLEDDVVIMAQSPRPERNKAFVEALASALERNPVLFTDIFYRVDLSFLADRSLLLLPDEDLEKVAKTLVKSKPALRKFLQSWGLVPLFSRINHQVKEAIKEGDEEKGEDLSDLLPSLRQLIDQMTTAVKGDPLPKAPVSSILSKEDMEKAQIYHTLKRGEIYLLLLKLKKDQEDGFTHGTTAIAKLRKTVEVVNTNFPDVNAGITGEPILENDEMVASERDTARATIISLILVTLIFAYGFREVFRPFLAVCTLLIAIGWSLGFTTLVVGSLNILTVTFFPMLIGLGIDFGIQVIGRYEEELGKQASPLAAMEATMGGTGKSILASGLTNSVAFLATQLTQFKGIQELGLIAGGSLLLALLAMLFVLPSLIFLRKGEWQDRPREISRKGFHFSILEEKILSQPWKVVWISAAITIIAMIGSMRVWFDYNLLNLQSKSLESVRAELSLIKAAERSVLYAAVTAPSVEQGENLQKRLETLPTVKSVESVIPILTYRPEVTQLKRSLIQTIQKTLRDISIPKTPSPSLRGEELMKNLSELRSTFRILLPFVAMEGDKNLSKRMKDLLHSMDGFMAYANGLDPSMVQNRLSSYQQRFFSDLRTKFFRFRNGDQFHPPAIKELPESLKRRFIGRTGKFLLEVYPRENVWEQKPLERFIGDLSDVAPMATGTPIMMYQFTRLLVKSYEIAALYAFIAIFVIVFLHFRRIKATIIVLVPLLTGVLWMLGILGLLNIPFNPANFLTLPLILGIGVANGIYVVRRFEEEGKASIFTTSTGRSILLCALTAMSGFGSLIFASHAGISSLGMVMTIGIGATLLTSLTLLPAILELHTRAGRSV